ncbi:MZA anti-phage system associated PD-(D/E)XK motif protein MzaD [Serratia sp. BW106]|uniref:MZA anti-phage system associated PD-(D/E)XK motif protein MzaD n=1 Tax=Serratia TaxID=613 RepID=UPI000BFFD103|nr:MZA anti-phage system associated PD-(D/E)XK motif protein MzaD [Serratia sp. BW106]
MVRLSKDDLLVAWKALDRSQIDEQPGAQGWRGIRLFTHQDCSFHAGRRQPDNEEMLIVEFPHPLSPGSTALPSCKGFRVEMTGTEEGRQNGLMIRRQQTGNADVFTTMILDILHSLLSVSEAHLFEILLRRIRLWQAFMERDTRLLSYEEEVGLIGELTCLERLIESGLVSSTAVGAWVGPQHGLQDFELDERAIEVKSTTAEQGFCVTIHSLEQLDWQRPGSLVLCGLRFNEHPTGATLNDIINRLRQRFEGSSQAACLFEGSLCHVGYFSEHAEFYTRHFLLTEAFGLPIEEDFPSLTHADVPLPVVSACYQLELQTLIPQAQNFNHCLSDFAGLPHGTY